MLLSPVINIFSAVVTSQYSQKYESLTCVLNEATTVTTIDAHSIGKVVIYGVYWKARPARGFHDITIPIGKSVKVAYRKGLTLFVHPHLDSSSSQTEKNCS